MKWALVHFLFQRKQCEIIASQKASQSTQEHDLGSPPTAAVLECKIGSPKTEPLPQTSCLTCRIRNLNIAVSDHNNSEYGLWMMCDPLDSI